MHLKQWLTVHAATVPLVAVLLRSSTTYCVTAWWHTALPTTGGTENLFDVLFVILEVAIGEPSGYCCTLIVRLGWHNG